MSILCGLGIHDMAEAKYFHMLVTWTDWGYDEDILSAVGLQCSRCQVRRLRRTDKLGGTPNKSLARRMEFWVAGND